MGERRQVAILFADLCGFTALSTRLDAEDLRRLVEEFYTRTNAIITQYGGTVDKHICNVVMALFGLSIAHGDEQPFSRHGSVTAESAANPTPLQDSACGPVDGAWRCCYSFTACQTLFTPSPVTSPGFLSLT